jgi:hypothetical protein
MQPDEFRYSPIQTLLEEKKILSVSSIKTYTISILCISKNSRSAELI